MQVAYLMPSIGNGSFGNPFKPKYFANLSGNQQQIKYGQQPLYFVLDDLDTVEQLALVTAALLAGDLLQFPNDLDSELTLVDDVLPLFAAAYESRELTADWMGSGMTYRTCARRAVMAQMNIANRMKVAGESMFAIPFDATLSQYSTNARNAFYAACDAAGLDRSLVNNTHTLREALADIVDSADSMQIVLGSYTV